MGREELMRQVAVSRMDFHTVKTGGNSIGSSLFVLGNCRAHFFNRHCTRRRRADSYIVLVSEQCPHMQTFNIFVET
ncbi:hypothetical protein D3C80_1728880 [compost metagenome]